MRIPGSDMRAPPLQREGDRPRSCSDRGPMLRQIRVAVRTLLRARSFSLTVVLTLALAIGASTAVFSVVRGVLLAPLPYPEPGRLIELFNWYRPDQQPRSEERRVGKGGGSRWSPY